MATKQTETNTSSRAYITKNPIRSTIGSIGYGTVNAIELAVESIATVRTLNQIMHKQLLVMEAELDNEIKLTKALASA